MAILTTTEVKTYLQITSTEYDNLISAYLPMCLTEFFDLANNYFDNNAVRVANVAITASSSDNTLIIDGTNFSTYSFLSGDEIHVRNSKRNDGFYTATSVSSATITVASSSVSVATFTLRSELVNEAEWTITKMDVPTSVKPLISAMIRYKIDNPLGLPQSESLGDYSVTYGGKGTGYPDNITNIIRSYSRVIFA